MLSRLLIQIASVILAGSGLGLVLGGIFSGFVHGRSERLSGPAERMIREGGYFGAVFGTLILVADLISGL